MFQLLVFVYILCLCWVLLSTLLATPIVLLVMMYLVTGDFDSQDCLDLKHYGQWDISPALLTAFSFVCFLNTWLCWDM